MILRKIFPPVLLAMLVAASLPLPVLAQGEMPPMGPPAELQEVAHLLGVWDVDFKYKMDPAATTWESDPATATFSWALDGCAMQMDYVGTMMGMPFQGISTTTYDRETKEWVDVWMDNMNARAVMYRGGFKDGKFITEGDDVTQGMKFKTRNTVFNQTADAYDWQMEMSMDGGATWSVWAKAKYTRKK